MSTDMIFRTRSTGSAETERLGEALGRLLRAPVTLELQADLGGGKTTLVRGFARGAGSADAVSSPSFTLSNIYKTKTSQIHHYDFYRLDDPGVLGDQLSESLNNAGSITIIEWSKIVEDVLPEDRITLALQPVAGNPDARDVSISYPESQAQVIKKLETELAGSRP